MKTKMTFEEYIINPMGKNNAVFSNMDLYRNLYTDKFNKLMVRENSKINYNILKSKDAYFIILKIPSESTENLYYDVCIKFDTKSVVPKTSIKDCPVKFFSNDPYFCYTFAYAFNKKGLFVDELESKMDKIFLTKKAIERNPSNEVGYDKIIYFAFLAMQLKGLFNTVKVDTESQPYSKESLLNLVTDSNSKINERQERGLLNRKKKKETKDPSQRVENNKLPFQTRKVQNTKSVKSTRSVKSTKRIGKR